MNRRLPLLLVAIIALLSGPPGCQATQGVYEAPDLSDKDISLVKSSLSAAIFAVDRRKVEFGAKSIPVTPGMHGFMFEHPSGVVGEVAFEAQAGHEYEIRSYYLGEVGPGLRVPQTKWSQIIEIRAQVLDISADEDIPFKWTAHMDSRYTDYSSVAGCDSGLPPPGDFKWGS